MTITALPTDPFSRRLQKIGQLINQGALPQAATELNAAIKLFPEDPRVFIQGSRLAEAAGNAKGAEEAMRKAVSLNPAWSVSATELAALLSRLNRSDEAMEQARKAVALEPDNTDLLVRVVDVARRAAQPAQAVAWLRQLSVLRPGSLQVKNMIARDLRLQGDTAQAMAMYEDILAVDPHDRDSLLGRAQLAMAAGDRAAAVRDCTTLVTLEPGNETFQFWKDVAEGKAPTRLPVDMARTTHDNIADRYEQYMVKQHNYQLPKVMADLILARFNDLAFNVLDLGCGTGLLGLFLGKLQGAMVGVDASEKMLQQAVKHQLYNRLHSVNLLDALQATPDALYHVIAACDTFPYVGDLSQAIPNALRILRPDGYLVFSCETAAEQESDLMLRPSLRFAHKASHVESLCKAAGFDTVEVIDVPLYYVDRNPVNGFIVVAHKPA